MITYSAVITNVTFDKVSYAQGESVKAKVKYTAAARRTGLADSIIDWAAGWTLKVQVSHEGTLLDSDQTTWVPISPVLLTSLNYEHETRYFNLGLMPPGGMTITVEVWKV